MSNVKYFPPAPIEFTEQQLKGITKACLVDDKLQVLVAPYFGARQDDQIELWLGHSEAESSGNYLVPGFFVADPEQMNKVYFTGDKLRTLDGRRAFFGYRVNGNELSTLVAIDIALSEYRKVR